MQYFAIFTLLYFIFFYKSFELLFPLSTKVLPIKKLVQVEVPCRLAVTSIQTASAARWEKAKEI